MNLLPKEKQAAVIAALCEGVSLRTVSRLHDVHRDTAMRLSAAVGQGCTAIHGKLMVELQVNRLELDEVWSFVKKKRRRVAADDPDTVGDQYIYLAMDSTSKSILSWLVGKRNYRNAQRFVDDVRFAYWASPRFLPMATHHTSRQSIWHSIAKYHTVLPTNRPCFWLAMAIPTATMPESS
jgi:hypothetical protein